MPKLVLKVAEGVPELPAVVQKDRALAVRRVRRMASASKDNDDLVAWLVDAGFLKENAKALCDNNRDAGSILVWNPGGKIPAPEGSLPDGLLYDEVFSFAKPQEFQRTLKNLFQRLQLERELAEKNRLLKEKEAENSELLQVGIQLTAEHDNDKLLAYILRQLRQITRADAGTLYLVERDEASGAQQLRFKIAQNDSNPRDYTEFVMPLSKKTISGYVASTGSVLNIEDAYKIPSNREYGFNVNMDKATGYRSKSMLTVPMQDHKGEILGVVQLINRKTDFALKITTANVESIVIPFSRELEQLVLSLASQAAVSLENNKLYQEIETLFEGFVKASVTAIESRDPTTSGHSNRVAVYTVNLARAVTRADFGAYKNVSFTPEHMKEIRYASLLHDFGKVGVREHVLVKAEKLYPDQIKLVKMRLGYIRQAMLYGLLKERFHSLMEGGKEAYLAIKEEIDRKEAEYVAEVDRYLATIETANIPTILDAAPAKALDEIHGKTFIEGETALPYLTDDEYIKLRIHRGSLDDEERLQIESHVSHTYKFLQTIPWTKEMRNIPVIAYGHHEKLDGTGYPRGIHGEEISTQTKMMTVSDIFDALTASDRPYKRAVPAQKALDILTDEVKENKLDADLVKIFIEAKVWESKDDSVALGSTAHAGS
ncbi:MAG TPA: HD domain-containing phosphohydrolase [Spirochaetia bacterium]|nr:HD domain-containing phosphohydrolase [Spirochaetia bacterium]